jgi:hypothetical protein
MAYLQVLPLGGSRDEAWRGQGIRERSVSWNLPKLSQLWRCNGGFRPRTTQNHLWTKQFVSGTWNSSRVAACVHRQTLYWNFMYHSRIVFSVGGSMWYVVRNLHCTVTIDSVLANSKTQNAFLFPVHAIFRHDCSLVVKHASTPRCLVQKTLRDSLQFDMLPFGVTISATVLQRSEILEGLMNYPVLRMASVNMK